VPLIDGSNQLVALMVTHAGITRRERYSFTIADSAQNSIDRGTCGPKSRRTSRVIYARLAEPVTLRDLFCLAEHV
jgi:hypothetical protein